ncbi:unnamed protein product [Urochloa decumbens]|uniref:PGG domain-containing protein n=1 Tax=Urochloa decumbens TaxID=240449 RepID=A0ABC9E2Q8_9POAL
MSGVQVSAGARASDSPAVVWEPPQQQLLQEVIVTQVSPEAVDGIITSEVVPPPQQQQQQGQAEVTVTKFPPEAVDEIIRRYKAFPKSETEELDEMRGWFMLLATLTASITYSAALNPPGGVWSDDDDKKGYVAGNPVLRDKSPRLYNAFYFCNFISFLSSLLIIATLSIPRIFNMSKMKICNVLVVLNIITLMGALTFGSARSTKDFVYDGLLLRSVFVSIIMARIVERL